MAAKAHREFEQAMVMPMHSYEELERKIVALKSAHENIIKYVPVNEKVKSAKSQIKSRYGKLGVTPIQFDDMVRKNDKLQKYGDLTEALRKLMTKPDEGDKRGHPSDYDTYDPKSHGKVSFDESTGSEMLRLGVVPEFLGKPRHKKLRKVSDAAQAAQEQASDSASDSASASDSDIGASAGAISSEQLKADNKRWKQERINKIFELKEPEERIGQFEYQYGIHLEPAKKSIPVYLQDLATKGMLGNYKYLGAGTDWYEILKSGDMTPLDAVDVLAQKHDLQYFEAEYSARDAAEKTELMRAADAEMLEELDLIVKNNSGAYSDNEKSVASKVATAMALKGHLPSMTSLYLPPMKKLSREESRKRMNPEQIRRAEEAEQAQQAVMQERLAKMQAENRHKASRPYVQRQEEEKKQDAEPEAEPEKVQFYHNMLIRTAEEPEPDDLNEEELEEWRQSKADEKAAYEEAHKMDDVDPSKTSGGLDNLRYTDKVVVGERSMRADLTRLGGDYVKLTSEEKARNVAFYSQLNFVKLGNGNGNQQMLPESYLGWGANNRLLESNHHQMQLRFAGALNTGNMFCAKRRDPSAAITARFGVVMTPQVQGHQAWQPVKPSNNWRLSDIGKPIQFARATSEMPTMFADRYDPTCRLFRPNIINGGIRV